MEYAGVAIIPLVIGLLEVFKKVGVQEKHIPILALILGLIAGIFLFNAEIKAGIVQGIYIGLSAVGLYSGTKNTIEGFKARE